MKFSIADQKKTYETVADVSEVVHDMAQIQDELVEVDISGNHFSPEAMEEICSVLGNAKNLRVVNLASVFLGLDKGKVHHNLAILSQALGKHKIQMIDLSDNAISSDFPEEFGDFISKTTELMHLRMDNCGLGRIGGDRLGESLKRIVDKSKLEIVEIAQNRFFSFPPALCEALVGFDNIRELRIQYNTIEEETMLEFLQAFREHALEVFDIRDNFLSVEGSRHLGELYCRWNLRELRTGDCMMGNEGVKEFLRRANRKFSPMMLPGDYEVGRSGIVLDISYNEFEQDAVELLVEFCSKNTVKELVVFGNYYEDVGEVTQVVVEKGGRVVTKERIEESGSSGDDVGESLIEKVAGL